MTKKNGKPPCSSKSKGRGGRVCTSFVTETGGDRFQDLVGTDFWESAHNRDGVIYCLMTWGVFRILLPDKFATKQVLDDLKKAKEVIVYELAEQYIFVFDSDSKQPFGFIVQSGEMVGFDPSKNEDGSPYRVSIWIRGCKKVYDHEVIYQPIVPKLKGTIDCPGLEEYVEPAKRYHHELPKELEPFYIYTRLFGHSIMASLENELNEDGKPKKYLLPVKTILQTGYKINNGYVWANIPISNIRGLLEDDKDREF
jgi:hypothetical protein